MVALAPPIQLPVALFESHVWPDLKTHIKEDLAQMNAEQIGLALAVNDFYVVRRLLAFGGTHPLTPTLSRSFAFMCT
jgi:hypothetical protein